jgi:4-hydroxy-tetrahydrodipicolinate synthase
MPNTSRPWRGVIVASALPFNEKLEVDFDRFASHVAWLADSGCQGITPNGSLGEYQTLTAAERRRVVEIAVEVAPEGFSVIPGSAAYGAREAREWTEQAAEAGAHAVLVLPPTAYRAEADSVIAHYAEVARVGLPIVAYNNPFDTKVDLKPSILSNLFHEGHIVAVKEFSGDVRRAYELAELAPDLEVLCGSDDVLLEMVIAGAKGWIAGYPNALPIECVDLYTALERGDLGVALPLYRLLHPLLRWDSQTEFVQAIKLSMDVVGRYGGPCRPPRQPLTSEVAQSIRRSTEMLVTASV